MRDKSLAAQDKRVQTGKLAQKTLAMTKIYLRDNGHLHALRSMPIANVKRSDVGKAIGRIAEQRGNTTAAREADPLAPEVRSPLDHRDKA
jgi:hypothetical protein